MVNFGPLTAEIGSLVWNFNGFRILPSLLQRRRSAEANQTVRCLAVSYAGTLHIHFLGILPAVGMLPGAKFTLRATLALSYRPIGSVTARHSTSECEPSVVQGMELRNFRRRHHLYSAGRPSRWASAHILVDSRFQLLSHAAL